jgi:hypothetical protein
MTGKTRQPRCHDGALGAYRELYGYQHPTEPIGPEPAGDSPEKRAAWHAALAALGPGGPGAAGDGR